MGCCSSDQAAATQWDDGEDEEVRALIKARDAAGGPTKVSLRITAALYDLDARSLLPGEAAPSFFVVVFEGAGSTSRVVGRSNTIAWNKSVPVLAFTPGILIQYRFEEVQTLVVKVYREKDRLAVLKDQIQVGEAQVDLGVVLGEGPVEEPLIDPSAGSLATVGQLVIEGEEVKPETVQEELVAVFSVSNLAARQAQPFLTLHRVLDQELVQVARTEHRPYPSQKLDMTTTWMPLHVKVDRLCKGDYKAVIVINLYDWHVSGKHSLIGSCQTTLETLLSRGFKAHEMVDMAKKISPSYQYSALLRVKNIKVEKTHTFLDFVKGGFDINLTVAVDFTKSNKPFDNDRSLHYRKSDNRTNEYMAAIQAVGSVMCTYDRDQEFPVYGFGARLPTGEISYCFPCSMMPDNVEASGLDGIAETYWSCLREVEPIEPTNLAPLIRKVNATARENQEKGVLSYQVLLIITDGAVSDLRQTTDAIVEASRHPISILIVGVGSSDDHFAKMRYLDADEDPLVSSSGEVMQRDVVGFVPFREYRHLPEALAKECLREIPRQFTTWTRQNAITLPENGPEEGSKRQRKRPVQARKIRSDNPEALPAAQLDEKAARKGGKLRRDLRHRLTMTKDLFLRRKHSESSKQDLSRPLMHSSVMSPLPSPVPTPTSAKDFPRELPSLLGNTSPLATPGIQHHNSLL